MDDLLAQEVQRLECRRRDLDRELDVLRSLRDDVRTQPLTDEQDR